jgi:hypothetical protein
MALRFRIAQLIGFALFIIGLGLAVTVDIGNAAPLKQSCEGQVITGGCFFTQTTNGQGGYSVLDDNQARFWTEYQRLGGAQTVGYPISRRFVYDGFVTQAFQKLVLQWRPEVGIAYPMNVFDELSEAGHDPRLFATRQTPYPLVNFDPPGATWAQVVAGRQALLNANVAIRSRYFSFSDPLNVFGLPTSRVEDMGNHYAVRTQRAVFQQWKEAVPWAGAGEVTIANGGDIAKEVGWFDPAWLVPENVPGSPAPTPTPEPVWEPYDLVVSAKQPGTLFLLQVKYFYTGRDFRLMVTRNSGTTWDEFIDGTVPTTCIEDITMDYNTPNELYILGCDGVYRWDGGEWAKISTLPHTGYVIQYGNPQTRWAIRDVGISGRELARTDDGGATWRRLSIFNMAGRELMVDSSTQRTLYAIDFRHDSVGGPALVRMDSSLENTQIDLDVDDDPSNAYLRPTAITINGSNGDVFYLISGNGDIPTRLWRSRNADEPDVTKIEWEVRYAVSNTLNTLAGGTDANGRFALYMIQAANPGNDELLVSVDEGLSWQSIATPR